MAIAKPKTIKKIDIEALALSEAFEIKELLDEHILKLQKEAKETVLDQVKDLLSGSGLDVSILSSLLPQGVAAVEGEVKKRKQMQPVRAKYRLNGVDWTGRGRTPKLIAEELERLNISVEEFKQDEQYRINQEE